MKRRFLVLLLVVILVGGTMTEVHATPSDAQIQAVLKQRIGQEKQSPGMVIGVIDANGSRVFQQGKMGRNDDRLVKGETIFEIGSVSKVFTGLALTQMAERGELKLTDSIAQFLPIKPPTRNGKEITLLSLATHTSGLPRLPDNMTPKNMGNPYADYTIEQLYQFLSKYHLTRDIGSQYEYSNLAVGLLGHILSSKSGNSYEALIKSQIAQPLQMNDTTIQISNQQKARFATGHNSINYPVSYWDLPTLAGAGGLRSTVNDLLKFLAANLQLNPSPLNAVLQKTHEVQHAADRPDTKIATAWHVVNFKGKEIITHSGGTGGFRSFVGFVKGDRLGIVVLANSENEVEDVGLHLLDSRIPLQKRTVVKDRQAIDLDPKLLDSYVGEYELMPNFILSITKEQNQLYLQATGQERVQLFAETPTEFFITQVDAQVTFEPKKNQLILHQAGQHLPAKRMK